jgi:hypothetical protein
MVIEDGGGGVHVTPTSRGRQGTVLFSTSPSCLLEHYNTGLVKEISSLSF